MLIIIINTNNNLIGNNEAVLLCIHIGKGIEIWGA
jgi:hypothetical protein